jgi:hypothetical protein
VYRASRRLDSSTRVDTSLEKRTIQNAERRNAGSDPAALQLSASSAAAVASHDDVLDESVLKDHRDVIVKNDLTDRHLPCTVER